MANSALQSVIEKYKKDNEKRNDINTANELLNMVDKLEKQAIYNQYIVNNIQLRYNDLDRKIRSMGPFQKFFHKDKIEEYEFYRRMYDLIDLYCSSNSIKNSNSTKQ